MPIKVLPAEVAAKIAAGEVVGRPASVVKELVENAIDAGATEIKIEMRQGGIRLMRVMDNGCGIPSDEVGLAFARHSTSKLESASDLARVSTLGFRGEALASIAAVAQVTLVSRTAQESLGTQVKVENGAIVGREGKGCPQGTVVTVENLFYNIPARLKFLRREATEAGHISQLVSRYALAYPELRFSLLTNGRLAFQSTGSGKLYDVLVKVYGLEAAQQMLLVEGGSGEPRAEGGKTAIRVHGYVSSPSLHRSNRQYLTFFVNRRWVQDRSLSYAASEAYHTLLPTGRYPIVVLNVDLDPAEVDVNVHPTKREVRFRRGNEVFAAVQKAVRRILAESSPLPTVASRLQTAGSPSAAPSVWGQPRRLTGVGGERRPVGQLAMEVQRTAEDALATTVTPQLRPKLPMLRVLGQLGQTYIIAEGPGGMYLIDQHTAHERVLYERFTAERARKAVASQQLLTPLTLELTPRQQAAMAEHLEALTELGFEIEPFGGETYLLRAVPAALERGDIGQAVAEILDELAEEDSGEAREEKALISVVCHSAVRAGQTLSMEEMRDLVRQLEETSLPHTCPHGRPTMIHLSAEQLAREFGRR
ncbi:MAG: DNA mismatch repair endonuclease MutL [Anaerolineales bacterium]|nr:MAG: DNA mismatch repair endonuclease MutL [Anaerolineales bacterium]